MMFELVERDPELEDAAAGAWRFSPRIPRAHYFEGRKIVAAYPIRAGGSAEDLERSACGLFSRATDHLFPFAGIPARECRLCRRILAARRRARAPWIIVDAEQVLCRGCGTRKLLAMAEGFELAAAVGIMRDFLEEHRACEKKLELEPAPVPRAAQTALDILADAGEASQL